MRERTRSTDVSVGTYQKTTDALSNSCDPYHPSVITVDDPVDVVTETKDEVMHDVETANYHRKSANGQIVNSPMDKRTTYRRDNPCFYTGDMSKAKWNTSCDPTKWTHNYFRWTWDRYPSSYFCGDFDDLPELPAYNNTALIDSTVTSAWSNVDLSEVQSLVAIAESGKTVASLISMFGRLIKIIKMIKRLDSKGLLYELSPAQLSDRYMELRYAIRPLMHDAINFSHALQTAAIKKPERQTFRGWTMYSDDGNDEWEGTPYSYTDNAGDWNHDENYRFEWTRHVDVRAGILCQIEYLNRIGIYGLTQPVEAIWELIPFSFIVDWFFNVGSTIGAWIPEMGTETLASWYVINTMEYQKLEHWHSNHEFVDGPSTTVIGMSWSRDLVDCWIDQTIVYRERVPSPIRAVVPTFTLRLDTLKLIDLLVIAKKILGGGLKSMPMGLRV